MSIVIVAFLADGHVQLESGRLPFLGELDFQRAALDRVGADLFTGPMRRVAPDVFVHTVARRTPGRPPGDWIRVEALTDAQTFPGEPGAAARAAVLAAAREHSGSTPVPPRRPEWYQRGWLDDVDRWVDACLATAGSRRTGASVVTRMWSLSTIVRVPAVAGTVYFKATGGPFDAEPVVTAMLAERYGGLMPTVLAGSRKTDARPGRGTRAWMLLEELHGVQEERAPGAAQALAGPLADLQARSGDDIRLLRAAGCQDRTAQSLIEGLALLLRESVELERLTPEEHAAARRAAPRMADLVRELWDCGLPETLAHGDLHVGNVAYDGTRVRVFDWTDAAVSHPFLDAVMLARSAVGDPASDTARDGGIRLEREVTDAYMDRWRSHRPDADVERALRLAIPVNELYQAISYEGIYRNQEDASRWELEGVVERFLRGLPQLVKQFG